jgi:hypothetical protein
MNDDDAGVAHDALVTRINTPPCTGFFWSGDPDHEAHPPTSDSFPVWAIVPA